MPYSFFTLLADASAAAPAGSPGGLNPTPIVYLLCFGAIFYFLAIRPQSQRQKEQDAMIKSVKTGDRVITSAGIHGMISNVT